MLVLLPLLLSASLSSAPVQAESQAGVVLHEPTSGATVTLPEDWTFATGEGGLMALSADERAFVLLAAAEKDFEQVRKDVRALILDRLDGVVVAKTSAEGVNERGALEEVVTVQGKGTSKKDGEAVEFAALLVRSGDAGVLVLGAWKDEVNAERVADVLAGLRVKKSAGEAGLEVTNARTGASVKIPVGWEVVRTRKGMLATCPDGNAMAILIGWQGDFEQSLQKIRGVLLGWVFKQVEFGEFAVIEASYDKSLGRVVASSGKAVDRVDDRPVEFTALRVQLVDKDEGAVLFGAWKDEKHAKEVEQLMSSLRIAKPKAK